jgi:hypothetical protein
VRDERAVRALVLDLVALHRDDVDAVLSRLAPEMRITVERLLNELRDFGFAGRTQDRPAAAAPDFSHFSPWLVERLEAEDDAMTAAGRALLRTLAQKLQPTPRPAEQSIRSRPAGRWRLLKGRAR